MKLLLKAALRVHRHLTLFIITFGALIGLTLASQMAMFTIGVISNAGSDFFALFASKDEKGNQKGYVTLEEVEGKWEKIDQGGEGKISKADAQSLKFALKEAKKLSKTPDDLLEKRHQKFHNYTADNERFAINQKGLII